MSAGLRAIQGRHRRGWTPRTLGTSLLGWYKAETITGLADGDPISTWSDLSGRGNDLTGITTTRPLYKTAILNGYPVVRFDGTDDVLKSANFGLAKPYTAVVVWHHRGAITAVRYIVDGLTAATAIYGLRVCTVGLIQVWGGAACVGSVGYAQDTWYVGAGYFDNSTASTIYVNNSQAPVTGNAGTSDGGGGIVVGARTDSAGACPLDTPEVFLVNGRMDATNLRRSFLYAGTKYNLAAS